METLNIFRATILATLGKTNKHTNPQEIKASTYPVLEGL